jgi:hypothetical protein
LLTRQVGNLPHLCQCVRITEDFSLDNVYILLSMRRALASLLLALFTIPLIVPALHTNGDSSLPECCRRGGKHHCAMSDMEQESPGGSALKAIQPRCPLFPGSSTAPGFAGTILPAALRLFIAPQSFTTPLHASNDVYTVYRGFSVPKRGPPSNFC